MLLDTEVVNKALDFAAVAHAGQVDKAGMPYILHPIRVATQLECESMQVIGLLHDVVEDTPVTIEEVRNEFGDFVADIVDLLTHREDEPYDDYINRVKTNSAAVEVKMADIHHNMQLGRIKNPKEKDIRRIDKYKRAIQQLSEVKTEE